MILCSRGGEATTCPWGGQELEILSNFSLQFGGSPTPQSGEQNQKLAHKWADWLHHPCCMRDHNASQRGRRIGHNTPAVPDSSDWVTKSHTLTETARLVKRRAGGGGGLGANEAGGGGGAEVDPHVAGLATSLLPSGGSPMHSSGGLTQQWPTGGKISYINLAVRAVSDASHQGDKIRSGPQVSGLATSPLLSRLSPMLQSGRQAGQQDSLHHRCRPQGYQRFKAGDKIIGGLDLGGLATSPLPCGAGTQQ